MRAKLLAANKVETHALIFDVGDEVVRSLLSFARENGIGAAHLVGIGAFSDVVLGTSTGKRRHMSESLWASRSRCCRLRGISRLATATLSSTPT
jgi:predicted DNA-binding protein with PD1-like motif